MTNINWVVTNLRDESHEVQHGILKDEQKNIDQVVADREDSFEIDYTEKGEVEYNILKNIYYPVIRQLIDEKVEYQNNDVRSKSNLIEKLEILDMQHESLMISKKFLWKEIDRGIEFLKRDCTNEFDIILVDYYEHAIRNSFFYVYQSRWNYELMEKLYYYDITLWKEVAHALVDLKYDFKYHHNIYLMNRNVWRLLSNFRDNKMGHIGTKIWMLFLISIFFEHDKDFHSNVRKMDIENMKEYLDLISSYQKQIDTQLIKEQRAIQNDMLDLYYFKMHSKEQDVFTSKTYDIVKALQRIPELKKKYLSDKGCFAIMTNGGKKYAAISGFHHESSILEKFFRDTLNNEYELIRLGLSTIYYYNDESYITYEMFNDNKLKCKEIQNVDYEKGMFSCCERKLLGELFDRGVKGKNTIYIKMKPCKMCARALEAYDEWSKTQSYICYPKGAKKPTIDRPIAKFDEVARDIKRRY